MGIYDDFQDVADQLLGDFAQGTIKLVKVTLSGDDWNPTKTPTEYTLNAVARGVSEKYRGMETDGGSVVQSSDLQVDMPGSGQVPTLDDHFLIDGTRYEILQVIPTPAAGTVAYYRCILRR